MATQIATRQDNAGIIEQVLVGGDLSKLSAEHRVVYYNRVCESLGLNPLTRPFEYITLNGKLTLYAKRDCTDQLRKIHGVSIQLTERQVIEGVCIVQARATDKSGRTDEATGAVSIAGLRGEAMANAILKAETKAKRRVTLSIVGMGMLDETEVESIPGAAAAEAPPPPQPSRPLGLPKGKPLTEEPDHSPETGEITDLDIVEIPFPTNGKANASTWRAYARQMAEAVQAAPDKQWLLDFQICNMKGVEALRAASESAHTWLAEQMSEVSRRLPDEQPENVLAAG
jgi:hypothetical protein